MTQTTVFITSHKQGNPWIDALAGKRTWQAHLASARLAHEVHLSLGSWNGGHEPSFLTTAHGALDAVIDVTREFVRQYRQECAIVCDLSGRHGALAQFRFAGADRQQLVAIDRILAQRFGGWTWARVNRQTALFLAHVPDWSDESPSVFREDIRDLWQALTAHGARSQVVIADCTSIIVD